MLAEHHEDRLDADLSWVGVDDGKISGLVVESAPKEVAAGVRISFAGRNSKFPRSSSFMRLARWWSDRHARRRQSPPDGRAGVGSCG
jgi:hypothetical protein